MVGGYGASRYAVMDSKHAKPQIDSRYLEDCGDCGDCKKESSPPGTEQGARAMEREEQ
jgi:hypothetical protein